MAKSLYGVRVCRHFQAGAAFAGCRCPTASSAVCQRHRLAWASNERDVGKTLVRYAHHSQIGVTFAGASTPLGPSSGRQRHRSCSAPQISAALAKSLYGVRYAHHSQAGAAFAGCRCPTAHPVGPNAIDLAWAPNDRCIGPTSVRYAVRATLKQARYSPGYRCLAASSAACQRHRPRLGFK